VTDHKALVRGHFDRLAGQRQRWVERNRFYYRDLEAFYRRAVQPGARVLEVGCGLGDLLAAVQPARGVGIDISPAFVELARQRHPQLAFLEMDAEALDLDETFDYVILAGTIGWLTDIQRAFSRIRGVCGPATRVIVTFHNFLWEPVLRVGEVIGQRMPLPPQNWVSEDDVANLLQLTGFRTVKRGKRLLFPKDVLGLAPALNVLGQLPLLNELCLTTYLVARLDSSAKLPKTPKKPDFSVSVVVPARNERGNIEPLMQRLPRLGRETEVIFVEGHSTDGTFEEIERVAAAYGRDWPIKVFKQEGRGKGDAMRKGFDLATGDILIILDADLSVAPEDLPKFVDVLATGRAELANGCRLVYPHTEQAMPVRNTLANKLFGNMFSYLLGQRFKDTLCGTKALWRRDYQKIAAGRSYFGDFDPFGDFDLLFGASRLNLHIVDVPVRYHERAYGRSNIQHVRAGLLLLRMCAYAARKLKFS